MILSKVFLGFAGVAGFTGVVLGALAAHALRHRLAEDALNSLATASAYMLVHGALLVAVALWCRMQPDFIVLRITGVLLIIGLCLFSGGISIAAISGIRAFSVAAPAGGIALMAAWLSLIVVAMSRW